MSNDTQIDQQNEANAVRSKQANPVPPANDLSFGLLMNRVMGGSSDARPSDKTGEDASIESFIIQAKNLSLMEDRYHQTYVIKGNKELYKLLGAIYSYALQIDASPLREAVLKRMIKVLEEKQEIKTQANTPWLTTIVRFILPKDRQTVYNYSRVLEVAYQEDLAGDELPAYIERRGGLAKVTATEDAAQTAKMSKEHKGKKIDMLKKILMANAKVAQVAPSGSDQYLDLVPENGKQGEFEYAICQKVGEETRIIRLVHLPEATEKSILASMADFVVSDDLEDMQNKLDDLRAALGITSGWGMAPGDKGYSIDGVPVVSNGE